MDDYVLTHHRRIFAAYHMQTKDNPMITIYMYWSEDPQDSTEISPWNIGLQLSFAKEKIIAWGPGLGRRR